MNIHTSVLAVVVAVAIATVGLVGTRAVASTSSPTTTAAVAHAPGPHVVDVDLTGPNTHVVRAYLTSGRIVRAFGPRRAATELSKAMRAAQTTGGAVVLVHRSMRVVYIGGRNLELVTMHPLTVHAS